MWKTSAFDWFNPILNNLRTFVANKEMSRNTFFFASKTVIADIFDKHVCACVSNTINDEQSLDFESAYLAFVQARVPEAGVNNCKNPVWSSQPEFKEEIIQIA